MRRWSSFFHLFLADTERLRALGDGAEGTVTLWVGEEPIVTLHFNDPDYCRDLAHAINTAARRPVLQTPEPGHPTLRIVKEKGS